METSKGVSFAELHALFEDLGPDAQLVLDAKIGYPKFFEAYGNLLESAREARAFAEGHLSELDEASIDQRLSDFFGYSPKDGPTKVCTSAMNAIGAAIHRFTKSHTSVIMLDPAYPTIEPDLIIPAGDGDRKAIHVDCTTHLAVV